MKAILKVLMVSGLLLTATGSNASWFFDDDNDWECMGPMGKIPGCNPYDEWDPRYWMEEMDQEFNDDDDYYRYGPYGGYGGPYGGYGAPYGGYGAPYGGYGAPYGGGYGAPYGGGYAPQPAPQQYAPQQQAPAPQPQYAPQY